MVQAYKIDSDGFIIDIIKLNNEITEGDIVSIRCPNGLHRPKWTGSEWVEGLVYWSVEIVISQDSKYDLVVNGTLLGDISNPVTKATLNIGEISFDFDVVDQIVSIPLSIHKVSKNKKIQFELASYGVNSFSSSLFDSDIQTSVTAKQDEDGSIYIKPVSKQEITYYYMTHTVSQSDIMTDLANWVDLITSIAMKLVETSTTTFVVEEQSAITDIKNNLLPLLRLKLSDATMTSTNPRYAQIVNQKEQANTNADEYLSLISDPDVK